MIFGNWLLLNCPVLLLCYVLCKKNQLQIYKNNSFWKNVVVKTEKIFSVFMGVVWKSLC